MDEKPQWSERGCLREGKEGELIEKILPLMLYIYVRIPMPISISCTGKGRKWGGARGSSPSAVCMYVKSTMNHIMM